MVGDLGFFLGGWGGGDEGVGRASVGGVYSCAEQLITDQSITADVCA